MLVADDDDDADDAMIDSDGDNDEEAIDSKAADAAARDGEGGGEDCDVWESDTTEAKDGDGVLNIDSDDDDNADDSDDE